MLWSFFNSLPSRHTQCSKAEKPWKVIQNCEAPLIYNQSIKVYLFFVNVPLNLNRLSNPLNLTPRFSPSLRNISSKSWPHFNSDIFSKRIQMRFAWVYLYPAPTREYSCNWLRKVTAGRMVGCSSWTDSGGILCA